VTLWMSKKRYVLGEIYETWVEESLEVGRGKGTEAAIICMIWNEWMIICKKN